MINIYKISLLTYCLFAFFLIKSNAQNGPIKDRLIISGGMQYIYKDGVRFSSIKHQSPDLRTQYRIDARYGVGKWFTAGVYLGHTFPKHYELIKDEHDRSIIVYTDERNYIINYGISAAFHPLNLLVKRENFRFDIYAAINLGGSNYFLKEGDKHSFGYSGQYLPFPYERIFLGGFSYYLTKNLGINAEASFFKHAFTNRRYRLAIIYKLNSKSNK